MSRHTWDTDGGDTEEIDDLVEWIVGEVDRGMLDGVTISGGEPFQQPDELHGVLDGLRVRLGPIDVLVYSGYTLAQLRRRFPQTVALVSALISGPYVAAIGDANGWRGSRNQRLTVIDEHLTERYRHPTVPTIQLDATDTSLTMTGVLRAGDLAEFERRMAVAGIHFEEVSW